MAKRLEYDLPLTPAQAKKLTAKLGPGLRELIECPVDQVSKIVKARWRRLKDPAVVKMAAMIARARPVRLVQSGGVSWLVFAWERAIKNAPGSAIVNDEDDVDRQELYLAEPVKATDFAAKIKQLGFKSSPALRELFTTFGELRDIEPGRAGEFLLPSPSRVFPEHGYDEEYSDTDGWHGAAVVYEATNGDRVLLRPNGSVGWAVVETSEVYAFGKGFRSVLERWLKARRAYEQGIDSWA